MLQSTVLAGAGFWVGCSSASRLAQSKSPNEKLDIAVIGVGGRGKANIDALATKKIVALCDVDDNRAGDAYTRYPGAKKFYD
jgi:Zn-dependent alcohol dehydrogenase